MRKFAPSLFFAFFCFWLLSFLLVRYYTVTELGFYSLPSGLMQLRAKISGILADVWMAAVCSILSALLFSLLLPKRIWQSKIAFFTIAAALFVVLGFLIAAQIPYVKFFGHFLAWQHIRYLFDWEFVSSSLADVADVRIWITAGVSSSFGIVVLWLAQSLPGNFFASSKKFLVICPTLIFIVGGLCQVTKVQLNTLKMGWSVPVTLRVNFLENALLEFLFAQQTPKLRGSQFKQLWDAKHQAIPAQRQDSPESRRLLNKPATPPFSDSTLKALLEENWLPAAQHSLGDVLRKSFERRFLNNNPTFVFMVILESFRPEESRTFYPKLPKTATPFIDELSAESLVFDNAYTAGGVTRAGQEALLCGLLSSEYTSAMRDLPSAQPRCLPALLKERFGAKSFSAWWHGGAFNFDSQGTFWKRQKTDFVLSREDFDSSFGAKSSLIAHSNAYPSTGWGVSDFFLIRRFSQEFMSLNSDAQLFFHSILSVTNHPGWVLPSDATPNLFVGLGNQALQNKLPNLLTTRYTDEALRQLVSFLKQQPCLRCESGSVWDNSLLFVSNDHGTLMPSLLQPQGYAWGMGDLQDQAAATSASKATLMMSGGLLKQAALAGGKNLPLTDRQLRSHLDVFATLADFLGLSSAATVGDSLFAEHRRWPVIVDLGARVFFPGATSPHKKVVLREELFARARDANCVLSNEEVVFLGIQNLHAQGISGK